MIFLPAWTAPIPSIGTPLRLRGISRTFAGGVRALDAIDLGVARGTFLAILGPSGCGKSTLLRVIAGLDRPTAGTVSMDDEEMTESVAYETGAASREFASYVFQDATLLPWRSVLRNVTLPLELKGITKSESSTRAAETLEQVGLADAINRYPAQLSGGMRMRVSLARALVTDPTLLLLDEPFGALDEITRQHLDEKLRALWIRRGMTVIFVTHSTTEAVFLAERAIVLSARPGHVVLDTPIDLPSDRDAIIRSDAAFARQTRVLFDALARGGA